MTQTVLSVVVEVEPLSAELLRERISCLRAAEEASPVKYRRIRQAVPALHFMSLTVFPDDAYDPVFVLEANFDGAPGPFWAQLEAAIGPQLRDMLRCCKLPGDGAAALFDAVTAAGSRAPIAPLLEACTVTPAVFHQGNRGLDRDRIEREGALFLEARTLADAPALRGEPPEKIHSALRKELMPRFPWLAAAEEPRVGRLENVADWARLLGFVVLAVGALGSPEVLLASVFKTWLLPVLLALTLGYFCLRLSELSTVQGRRSTLASLVGLAVLLALAANLWVHFARIHIWGPRDLDWLLLRCLYAFLVFLLEVATAAAGLLVWLRRLERADPSQDAPHLDEGVQRRIARSEDQTVQNHMISIVHIKPGLLRAVLIRAGLWGLGYVLRVTARDGYLASMRTIHFAHWALISDCGRLMFHSNFDGSWESYLDDFIEKAHVGLTLAWTNGVGFPRTRFLINEGATQGRKFKAWARHSMTESQFWFSAYKDLTVNQIERQARIADGLRQPTLNPEKAAIWVLDL